MRNPMSKPCAFEALLRRRTPLLKVGRAFAKLECLRPTGGVDDRVVALWDKTADGPRLAAGTQGAALAGAAWARSRGISLTQLVHGPLTHEVRKALEVWGVAFEHVPSRAEAWQRVAKDPLGLPPLDGDAAALRSSATLGRELVDELDEAGLVPALLVAPAGARAALIGCALALRSRWPALRVVGLLGEPGEAELPELPTEIAAHPALSEIELLGISRAFAAKARASLTRRAGLLAGHAGAAAVQVADDRAASLEGEVAVALVTSTGEREFSLDAAEPA